MNGCVDAPVGFRFHRNRENQRQGFDVPNRLTYRFRPKRNDRYSATYPSQVSFHFYERAHLILLREFLRNFKNVIFAPLDARSMKGPHFVRSCRRVCQRCVQPMPIQIHRIEFHFLVSRIPNRAGDKSYVGEVVVHFHNQRFFHISR